MAVAVVVALVAAVGVVGAVAVAVAVVVLGDVAVAVVVALVVDGVVEYFIYIYIYIVVGQVIYIMLQFPQETINYFKSIYNLPLKLVGIRMACCAPPGRACSPDATFLHGSAPACQEPLQLSKVF